MDEPIQDVESFDNKIYKITHQISRKWSDPIELSTLISTALTNCKIMDFHLKTEGLNDLVDIKSKTLSVDDIIQTQKMKVLYLKSQGS